MNKPRFSSHSTRQSSYKAKRDALAQNPAFDKMVADFETSLREIARHQRQKEHYCTMSTTDIVSEAYMRLRRNVPTGIEDLAVFKATATVIMREILIDAARRRRAEKRGGGQILLTLSSAYKVAVTWDNTFLDWERCLDDLYEGNAEVAEAIDMQFYGGFTVAEIAKYQGTSLSTVARNLRVGVRWLKAKAGLQPPPSMKKAA